jgi:hypothetical protein
LIWKNYMTNWCFIHGSWSQFCWKKIRTKIKTSTLKFHIESSSVTQILIWPSLSWDQRWHESHKNSLHVAWRGVTCTIQCVKGRSDSLVDFRDNGGGYCGDQGMVLMVTQYLSCGQQLFTLFFMLAHKYFYGLIHNGSILIGHRSKSYGLNMESDTSFKGVKRNHM